MKRFLLENQLSLFFAVLFASTITAQSFAGQHAYNAEQLEHGGRAVSWWTYVTSPEYWGAVTENWQSEFLQFTVFIAATVWLVQKGSNESKPPGQAGRESDEKQLVGGFAQANSPAWAKVRDWRLKLYENSLLIVMATIFFATWFVQSLSNTHVFNEEQLAHGEPKVTWFEYLLEPDFWNRTLQNWQSEFLAVGTMAVFTVYLRQRGSPESKPVGSPHDATGESG
jgi:Domain of unknown function (DUF6766)